MPAWGSKLAAGVLSRLPTLLILALLGGIAAWGIANDWKIASSGTSAEENKETDAGPVVRTVPGPPSRADSPGAPRVPVTLIEFPSEAAVTKAGINDEPAVTRPMTRYVTANGMLDYVPAHFAQLASPVDGKVWRVVKGFGDPVRKGDVLALIDSADVGKAKADFVQSLTRVDVAAQRVKDMRAAASSVPEATLRQAQADLREARVRLYNDHQRLLNLGLPVHLNEVEPLSEKERFRYLRLLGLPEGLRKDLGKEIDLDTLTANLLPLTATFDGVVVRHPRAAPGEVVSATRPQPLFTVADVRTLHIELEVQQEDVRNLRIGQEVIFHPESQGGEEARGELAHISAEVNEKTRRVLVHAELTNPEVSPGRYKFRPNTFGTGRIVIRKNKEAVAVPDAALQSEIPATHGKDKGSPAAAGAAPAPQGPVWFVFVRRSGKVFEKRPVQLGIRAEGWTEVTGVRAGERVVTKGSFELKSELQKEKIEGEE